MQKLKKYFLKTLDFNPSTFFPFIFLIKNLINLTFILDLTFLVNKIWPTSLYFSLMPWGLFLLLKIIFKNYKINLTHKKQFWRVNDNGFDPTCGYVGKGPNPSKSNKNNKILLLLPPFFHLDS